VPNWKNFVQDRRRWKWLRRQKLCIKRCRAVLRRRRRRRRRRKRRNRRRRRRGRRFLR